MTKSEMRLERATRIFIEFVDPDVNLDWLTEHAPKKAMLMALSLENEHGHYEEMRKGPTSSVEPIQLHPFRCDRE